MSGQGKRRRHINLQPPNVSCLVGAATFVCFCWQDAKKCSVRPSGNHGGESVKLDGYTAKPPSSVSSRSGFYASQFCGIEFITSLRCYTVSRTKPLQPVRMTDNQGGVSGEVDSLSQRISFQNLVWRSINLTPAHGMSLAPIASRPPREEVRTNEGPAQQPGMVWWNRLVFLTSVSRLVQPSQEMVTTKTSSSGNGNYSRDSGVMLVISKSFSLSDITFVNRYKALMS